MLCKIHCLRCTGALPAHNNHSEVLSRLVVISASNTRAFLSILSMMPQCGIAPSQKGDYMIAMHQQSYPTLWSTRSPQTLCTLVVAFPSPFIHEFTQYSRQFAILLRQTLHRHLDTIIVRLHKSQTINTTVKRATQMNISSCW